MSIWIDYIDFVCGVIPAAEKARNNPHAFVWWNVSVNILGSRYLCLVASVKKGVEIMGTSFPVRLFHVFAMLCLLTFLSMLPGRSSAASPDPRMYGPWVVVNSENTENVGLRAFFSPDGNFLMVDPRTQLGFTGNWSVGRTGLLVSILGNSRWGKLWDADVSFPDNDHMVLDVKDSQFSLPHRITLQRIRM